MEAYRDQYATIFRGGRGITVIAVSTDSVEELASWARDADFPMLFASDTDGTALRAFGVGVRESGATGHRMVAVIDPDGRVAHVMSPFREIDPTAYEELGAAVAEVAPDLEAEGDDGAAELAASRTTSMVYGDC